MRRNGSASIKKGDVLLILIILVLAGGTFLYSRLGRQPGNRVQVAIDGKEYGSWSLDEDRIISIEERGFHNTLQIRDGKASMREADCPDKICVHHKPVCYGGESIICLPHKLVVSVEAGQDGEESSIDAVSK